MSLLFVICISCTSAASADHMWWASSPGRASHPNPEAPRCLPCDFDDSKFDHSLKPFNAPKGCPCTAQLICETDERGIFNQYCDVPKAPMSTYSMHGGAGGIISIGMLRAVSLDYMEKCIKSLYSTGICLSLIDEVSVAVSTIAHVGLLHVLIMNWSFLCNSP